MTGLSFEQSMNLLLLVGLGLAVALVVFNPANWIRLALWIVGPSRRSRFMAALQKQIDGEPDMNKRFLYQHFMDEVKRHDH